MYLIDIVIKNVDENEKVYVLVRIDEDAHTGNYIEDIYQLFCMGLKSVHSDSWDVECLGPEGDDSIDDKFAFCLNTEQICILNNTWEKRERPFPANNDLEQKQMASLRKAVRDICEGLDA